MGFSLQSGLGSPFPRYPSQKGRISLGVFADLLAAMHFYAWAILLPKTGDKQFFLNKETYSYNMPFFKI